jgi:hypothetical protein
VTDTPDHGPQRPVTINLPDDMWRVVKTLAASQGVTASAIVAELVAALVSSPADVQADIAARARHWMRPRGGAAARDGD